MGEQKQEWHSEVIPEHSQQTLSELSESGILNGFYLAGGTGLALYLGHRLSQDLDFFKESFDEEYLLQRLTEQVELSVVFKGQETLHLQIRGTKVSFLGYTYPLLFPLSPFFKVSVAHPQDIACMKISAIASRGTRRDFIDLYAISQQYGLAHLLELFQTKFARANYNILHILKSLAYFEDAEREPMPDLLVPISWKEVKRFFTKESPRLL